MIKPLLLLAFCVLPVFATGYTASLSGQWSNSSTWGGAGVPGTGDSVTISNTITVYVTGPSATIIGTSPAPGTLAINTNDSGAVVICGIATAGNCTSAGTLQVRGDIRYNGGGGNMSAYLTILAGGTFEWDSSLASSPFSTRYSAYPSTNPGYRQFLSPGTASSRNTVFSNAGGANGYFQNPSSLGGSYTTSYTDFLRIGDASTPAFMMWSDNASASPKWSALHDSFTACGEISTTGSMYATEIFQHSFNVHVGTVGPSVINRTGDLNFVQPLTTGVGIRDLIGNIFDIVVGNGSEAGFDARDFTVHSNYFASKFVTINFQAYAWRYFQNNFYREPVGTGNDFLVLMGDTRDNLFFLDDPNALNPHGLDLAAHVPQTMYGDIVDHAGQINSQISSWQISNAYELATGTYVIANEILLPNAAGHGSWWLSVLLQPTSPGTYSSWVNHNTAIIDSASIGGTGVLTGHPGSNFNFTGQLGSFQSNILWNPVAVGQAFKMEVGQNPSPNTNVCLPANCDYNAGWNMATGGGGFTGGANGYSEVFTGGTPGAHDAALAGNPGFVDPTRNTATFDSAYLHNSATAWGSGNTYSVGNLVSSADSGTYSSTAICSAAGTCFPGTGAVINYRYTNGSWNGTSCASGNPKPGIISGSYALSRACWEFASLYDIRQASGSSAINTCPGTGTRDPASGQCLYDDQTIGASGVDIITTLIQWIRSGFSPTAQRLAIAGPDGQDIGAVPVTFSPATFPGTLPGCTVCGATIRGGLVR